MKHSPQPAIENPWEPSTAGSRFRFHSKNWPFLIIVCVFALLTIVMLALASANKNAADHSRETQLALDQTAVVVQELHDTIWLATAVQEITPESEAKLEIEARQLSAAGSRMESSSPEGGDLMSSISAFIASVRTQAEFARMGQFEQARIADFEDVNPRLDALQHEIEQMRNRVNVSTQASASHAYLEFVSALSLIAITMVIIILYWQRQQHVMLAKHAALEESEDRFRSLTEKSSDVVVITDFVGNISYVSPSAATALGLPDSAFQGRAIGSFIHPEDTVALTTAIAAAEKDQGNAELRIRHAKGRWLDFECVVRDLRDQPTIGGLVFNLREITERKKAQQQLLFNATHDQLTGLPNRVMFLNRLQTVLDRIQRRRQRSAAVLFLDIDDFKLINDCLGHAAGDELIIEVGRRLVGCMREDGTVARIGGDEFTILLEDAVDPSDAIRVAQRIHTAVTGPFVLCGQEVCKGISIGIAMALEGASAETVLQNADIALYRAKTKGKGRFELFDSTMQEQVMGDMQMETRLRHALNDNELKLYFQPIVSVTTGVIEGFEALLRWESAGTDPVSPAVFVPLAERSGLIVPISVWVLETACREAAGWHLRRAMNPPLYVSINVSARHFSHPGFAEHLTQALRASGIRPDCVKIELTESAAMNDGKATTEMMAKMRSLGVKLSIDDFGTGYSSLSYLKRFAVDTLKIDKSFIAGIETDEQSLSIVGTVVALGRNLGLEVVAEGVETQSQLQKLRLLGCDAAQGFLLSRPIPAELVDAALEKNYNPEASATGSPMADAKSAGSAS